MPKPSPAEYKIGDRINSVQWGDGTIEKITPMTSIIPPRDLVVLTVKWDAGNTNVIEREIG